MAFKQIKLDEFSKVIDDKREITLEKKRGYGSEGMAFILYLGNVEFKIHVIQKLRNNKNGWIVVNISYPESFRGCKSAIRELVSEALNAYRDLVYTRVRHKIEVFIDAD